MFRSDSRSRWLILAIALTLAISMNFMSLGAPKGTNSAGSQQANGIQSMPTVDQLLTKAFRSEAQTGYSGSQVVVKRVGNGSKTEISRVYHKKPDKYRTELDRLTNYGDRIVIDDGKSVWTYSEQKPNRVVQDDSTSGGPTAIPWQRRRQLVDNNYTVYGEGLDRVAGRQGAILSFYPKWQPLFSGSSPAWRFWVDMDTGLTLRSERYDKDGSISEQRYFTELNINPSLDDDLFHPPLTSGVEVAKQLRPKFYKSLDQLADKVTIPIKLPSKLPGGFEFAWGSYRKLGEQTALWLMFTDGLASLSVFQTFPPTGLKAKTVEMDGGAESMFEASTNLSDIVVLGDLGQEELSKMVDSTLASMGLQVQAAKAQVKSVQDKIADQLNSVMKFLGIGDDPGK